MYNRVDSDQAATLDRLAGRTRRFFAEADVADADSLAAFRGRYEETRADYKLLDGLPNCPFLGLLDYDEARPTRDHRVGCLVHPLQNDGVDGRDCGVYDRHTCQDYLCAAHDLLRDAEKLLVVQAVSDAYLYGLVITDVRFVRELLELAARHNGAWPKADRLQRPAAVEAAGAYFELKRDWPWAAADGRFGQMRPGEGLETSRRAGPSEALGAEADPYEAALTCLGTEVDSRAALAAARQAVADRVVAFAEAVA